MKELHFTIIVLVSFLMINCGSMSEDLERQNQVVIDVAPVQTESFLESCVDVKVIPLATMKESLIGKYGKALYLDKMILILDKKSNTIKVFDSDGEFKEVIENTGDGPGEFYQLSDINYNRFSKKLELLTPRGELISYDFKKKYFQKELDLPVISVAFFTVISDDILAYYSLFDDNRLVLYSRSGGRIISILLNSIDVNRLARINIDSPFYTGEDVKFLDPITHDIYLINENGLELVYDLDFGDANFKIQEVPKSVGGDIRGFVNYLKDNRLVFSVKIEFETQRTICISAIHANSSFVHALIDKNDLSVSYTNVGAEDFYEPFEFSDSRNFYGIALQPDRLDNILSNANYDFDLQILNEEDNLVLLKYEECGKFFQ